MDEKVLKEILSFIKNGNNLGEKVYLVGATKTVPVQTINRACELGLEIVAENKVQEFREKTDLITNAEQHFIGHLQTNKVKYLVGKVSLIQSVDSIRLAEEISRQALKKSVCQDILIEINIGGELSKSGFDFDNCLDAVKQISKLEGVKVKGLMAMLPHVDDKEMLKNLCLKMRGLYDTMIKDGYDFKYLSVGMSNDYQIAIANGSNMIRLGSKIFGKRNYGV